MRTRMSWVLTVFGALCAVAGITVMLILGPDSRFSTGPHAVETDGIAVVTAPKVITWADVQIDVLVEVPVKKPVFVGLGNSVDVQNLLGDTARLEVTDFHTPWKVKTRQVDGKPGLPGAPISLDWWLADGAGLGGASISTKLPDETVSLAIMSVGDSTLSGLKVSLAYGIKGGFATGFGLLLLGAGGVWLSRLLRRGENIWADEEIAEEEVVYVYVDNDGVEHEISADEAQDYEIVDPDEDDVVTEAEPEPETETDSKPEPSEEPDEPQDEVRAAGDDEDEEVVHIYVDEDGVEHEITAEEAEAYEFVDEVVLDVEGTDPTDEPSEPSEPSEPVEPKERVMYVFVDEDGVEHEVSEDELADFEVVDEDLSGEEEKQ